MEICLETHTHTHTHTHIYIYKVMSWPDVLNGRWAMLGTLWCLFREVLQKYTAIDNGASKGVWFRAGAMIFGSDGLNYTGTPVLVRAQSILAVLACQVVQMGAIEAYRVNGGPFGGRDLDLVYPSGKRFDPLGLAGDPDVAAELKVKKIRSGRLEMLSTFGYFVQAAVSGQGPVGKWASHIADPFAVNRVTLEIAAAYVPSVAMLAAARKKKAAAPKVDLSSWYGPDCKRWLGLNTAGSCVTYYLTGEYLGVYGWNSAGLVADPKTVECLREAEVVHDRWPMLGTLWSLAPELLQKYTAIDNGASKVVWFEADAMIFESYGLNYMGAPVLVRVHSILAVLACQVVLMGAMEAYRVNGGPFGERDLDLVCPGGKGFDAPGLVGDLDMAAELKGKEIRSSRLVMLPMFGCYVQGADTSQGPSENWASHIADPFAVNGMTLEIATQYTPSVAIFAAAGKNKAAAPKVDLFGWYGPDCKKWWGPDLASSYAPYYLTGEYPDDYGWDNAGLAAHPKTFKRLSVAEVLHDR